MSRLLKTGTNQITQSYEKHIAKVKAGQGWAKGVDIVKAPGWTDTITAHSAGTVIKTMTGQVNGKNDPEGFGYGNYVMISHQNNYVTLYAHLAGVSVKKGERVLAGQAIGMMGNTGNSYGAHLHFELRKYSSDPGSISDLHNTSKFTWLNPEPYIDAKLPDSIGEKQSFYRVQTGSFEILDNAVRYARALQSKGYPVIIKKSGKYHRVQLGAFINRQNAERFLSQLKAAGYSDAYITTEGGTDIPF